VGTQLVTLVSSFVLTTVLGGLLAYFFQRRSWDHQYRVQLDERERDRAISVFEEVSRLLDKRLYRMRLLFWSLTDEPPVEPLPDTPTVEDRMASYRDVLVEWNDGINRLLALTQHSYGPAMRARLDNDLGAEFVYVGRHLQDLRKTSEVDEGVRDVIGARLRALGGLVYQFNLDMLRAVEAKEGERRLT